MWKLTQPNNVKKGKWENQIKNKQTNKQTNKT